MKAIVYLLKTTIINYFKRLKEKPQKAIGPVFVILWMFFMFLPKGKKSGNPIPKEVFVSLFVFVMIIMFFYSLYSGTKKVKSKFSMCDVNLIFVSPIKPQTVMLYGVIKKIAVELFASFYLLYQLPNLLKDFNIPVINEVMIIISFVIFQLVFCNIVKLLVFALNTRYKGLGSIIRNSIKAFSLCVAAGVVLLIVKGSFLSFFENLFNTITYSYWVQFIPVFGWMKELARQTIMGINLSFAVYLVMILLLSGLLLYITYNIEVDFYEDMLSSAESNELILGVKHNKEGAAKRRNGLIKPFRKKELKLNSTYGAKVLFFKHMNEYFKRSLVFFINTYSLCLLVISILLGVVAKGLDIKFIFLAASGMLFFASGFGGKIYSEISYYFIFLMPDSPYKKLFYGSASSLVKIFADAILLFVPFGILRGTSIFEIVLCIACYLALGGMLAYSGLFAFRIAEFLGFTGAIAQGLLFMFFQLFLAVPAVIIVAILTYKFNMFSSFAIYAAILAYSIGAAALFSLGCVGLFNNMEFRD